MKKHWVLFVAIATLACFGLSSALTSLAGPSAGDTATGSAKFPLSLARRYVDADTRERPLQEVRRTWSASALERIELGVVSAPVRIHPSKGDSIEVAYRMRGQPVFLEKIDGDTLKLKEELVEDRNFEISFSRSTIEDIEILVPRSVRRLKIKTVSGDVIAEDLALDEIKVESISGDARFIGTAAKLKNKSVSGNVVLRPAGGAPEAEVETISGNVELSLGTEPDARVEFASASGTLRLRFPGIEGAHERHYSDRLGKGQGDIRIRTVSGDAKIESP